jgi:c-di-GMP-binding flagellar brake protein YcgR
MNTAQTDIGATIGNMADRRGNSRFPVREEVRYRVLNAKKLNVTGVGKTLNISSGGILFSTEEKLPMGKLVEVAVNWPARLGGSCALKFVVVGRIVRAEADKAAVRIERYEFKTRSSRVGC